MKYTVIGLIVLALLIVTAGCELLDGFAAKEDVWVYKHLELGTFLYCDTDQGNPKDYEFIGTSKVSADKAERCFLAQ